MLKKEHIKQAIDAISQRDAAIGYTLDAMLGLGRITPVAQGTDDSGGGDFRFLFDDRPATVRRVLFFNQGTVPIEERLLVKYGEMLHQHQLTESRSTINFREAATSVREAGLRLLVCHEVAYALDRLQQAVETGRIDPAWAEKKRFGLQALRHEASASQELPGGAEKTSDPAMAYTGTVDDGKPAAFIRFPFTMATLMQAADINLDFFNLRFLLSCWETGREKDLFAGVGNGHIQGLVYLTHKARFFTRAVEIQYIATVRGRPETEAGPGRKALKGVGTFLVAGVWMLWKTRLTECRELLLDAEVGARQFYEGIGFEPRGLSGFVMKTPEGRLVRAIVEMAAHCPDLPEQTTAETLRLVRKQVRSLRQKAFSPKNGRARRHALESIHACLQSGFHAAAARTAREELTRWRRRIPEADALIAGAGNTGQGHG